MDEEKKTVQIPKADPIQILQKLVQDSISAVNKLAADLESRQETFEKKYWDKLDELERRMTRGSERARASKTTDLEHEAALSKEIIRRKEWEESMEAKQNSQLSILTRVDRIIGNPTAKMLGFALATAIMGWLGQHCGH